MKKILRIDRTSDVLTQAAYDYRSGFVYPKFSEKGFQVIPDLQTEGPIALRENVEARDQDQDIIFITASCHGKRDVLLGNSEEDLFPMGIYSPNEVKGRVVHFLACATALDLGPDFIRKGCSAFIGYNNDFIYQEAWARVFFSCDAEIDLALVEGKSVAEAIGIAKKRFDLEIGNPSNKAIAQALENRRDSLIGLPPENLNNIRLLDPAAPLALPIF